MDEGLCGIFEALYDRYNGDGDLSEMSTCLLEQFNTVGVTCVVPTPAPPGVEIVEKGETL